jgi:Flp pilus assembly protein TadG
MTGRGRDAGTVSAFTAAMVITIIAVGGLVLDGGLALATKARAYHLAAEAARTGAQQLDLAAYRATGQTVLDPDAALAAAETRLAHEIATGQVTVTGAEVTVTVTTTHHTQLLGVFGLGAITVDATATAQAQHGITAPGAAP